MEQRWPSTLWIVRHGQSAGNVARDAADAAGMGRIDIADRDMDVALSAAGRGAGRALGRWLAAQPAADERPRTLMTSPYLRAIQTSQAVRDAGGMAEPTASSASTSGCARRSSASSTA
jgi:probable phosphoglycerate mutase